MLFTLTNQQGDCVTLWSFGARIHQWQLQLACGKREIMVSYLNPEQHADDHSSMGAITGPVANRIAQAQGYIDGKLVKFAANEGQNLLHGGKDSLARQIWHGQQLADHHVVFSCELADGYNGFPGPVTYEIDYQLNAERALVITLSASSKKTTPVSLTSHGYFNLLGEQQPVFGHFLQLAANAFTPVNVEKIPTGEIHDVANSSFDFQIERQLATNLDAELDCNFAIAGQLTQQCAQLVSPQRDIALRVFTDYPGLQVYTAGHLVAPFVAHQGICLEPQFFPNAINEPSFEFAWASAGQDVSKTIIYQIVEL